MDWLRRLGRSSGSSATEDPPAPPAPKPVGGATPGVAALLEGVREDGTRSVLDLGPADPESFRVYSRFGRRVRFADLFGVGEAEGWVPALEALPPQPEQPYDLILGWDILDRLPPALRPRFIERLVGVSAPGAGLHLIVRASEQSEVPALHFSLHDVDRMSYEPSGGSMPARAPILPAELERLISPFEVVRAFTLKGGLRECAARKRAG
jgi:hypothetical protein